MASVKLGDAARLLNAQGASGKELIPSLDYAISMIAGTDPGAKPSPAQVQKMMAGIDPIPDAKTLVSGVNNAVAPAPPPIVPVPTQPTPTPKKRRGRPPKVRVQTPSPSTATSPQPEPPVQAEISPATVAPPPDIAATKIEPVVEAPPVATQIVTPTTTPIVPPPVASATKAPKASVLVPSGTDSGSVLEVLRKIQAGITGTNDKLESTVKVLGTLKDSIDELTTKMLDSKGSDESDVEEEDEDEEDKEKKKKKKKNPTFFQGLAKQDSFEGAGGFLADATIGAIKSSIYNVSMGAGLYATQKLVPEKHQQKVIDTLGLETNYHNNEAEEEESDHKKKKTKAKVESEEIKADPDSGDEGEVIIAEKESELVKLTEEEMIPILVNIRDLMQTLVNAKTADEQEEDQDEPKKSKIPSTPKTKPGEVDPTAETVDSPAIIQAEAEGSVLGDLIALLLPELLAGAAMIGEWIALPIAVGVAVEQLTEYIATLVGSFKVFGTTIGDIEGKVLNFLGLGGSEGVNNDGTIEGVNQKASPVTYDQIQKMKADGTYDDYVKTATQTKDASTQNTIDQSRTNTSTTIQGGSTSIEQPSVKVLSSDIVPPVTQSMPYPDNKSTYEGTTQMVSKADDGWYTDPKSKVVYDGDSSSSKMVESTGSYPNIQMGPVSDKIMPSDVPRNKLDDIVNVNHEISSKSSGPPVIFAPQTTNVTNGGGGASAPTIINPSSVRAIEPSFIRVADRQYISK